MVEGILKGCDIILALSENTINFQFEQLYKKNIIPKKWNAQDGSIESEFEAKIESPMISIIEDERKKLNLEISFTSGTLSYWKGFGPSATRMTENMKGWKYVFEVNLGLISHPADEFVSGNAYSLTVTQEATKQVKDSIDGISDKYFTIESLFMDFTNTNFTQYDTSKSVIIVDDPSALDAFQILISNYFKRLAETQNPYILGHSIKRIDHGSQSALFQPTNCRYSTSYNKKSELSALNFLMMIDGNRFPEAQDTGILPQSLIIKEGASVDGVLVLNYQEFKIKYIDQNIIPVIKSIVGRFIDDIRGLQIKVEDGLYSWERCEITGFENIPNIELKESEGCLWQANMKGCIKGSSTSLGFECQASHKEDVNFNFALSLESKNDNYLDFILRVIVDINFSYDEFIAGTMGIHEKGSMSNKEKEYKIHIKIQPAQHGKIKIKINCDEGVFIENNMQKINSLLYNISHQFKNSVSAGYSQIENSVKEIVPKLKSEFTTITAQKTVLPLGNVYTYQNIRLFYPDQRSKNPINNAVCFDVGYTSVINK